jgi:hypothetical protein
MTAYSDVTGETSNDNGTYGNNCKKARLFCNLIASVSLSTRYLDESEQLRVIGGKKRNQNMMRRNF